VAAWAGTVATIDAALDAYEASVTDVQVVHALGTTRRALALVARRVEAC
jgi:hypothetical protein